MPQKHVPTKLKAFALVLLVLQTTTLVLTMRFSQTQHDRPDASKKSRKKYLVSSAVVMAEIVKCISNLLILYVHSSKCQFSRFRREVKRCFVTEWRESGKVTVTAAIYTVQNNLLYLAAANLDAATYQVSYQTKILTTAMFSMILPPRKWISCKKWISLVILTAGVTLVQLDKVSTSTTSTSNSSQNYQIGLAAILTSAVTSGFAGIYFERTMKGGDHGMWMVNLESAVFSIFFGWAAAMWKDSDAISRDGWFQGYDGYTVAAVFLQAYGGMIIVAVVNYTDNIIKCFANACSILTSALASYFILHDFVPTWLFLSGAALVIFSIFLYSSKDDFMTLPCMGAGLNTAQAADQSHELLLPTSTERTDRHSPRSGTSEARRRSSHHLNTSGNYSRKHNARLESLKHKNNVHIA